MRNKKVVFLLAFQVAIMACNLPVNNIQNKDNKSFSTQNVKSNNTSNTPTRDEAQPPTHPADFDNVIEDYDSAIHGMLTVVYKNNSKVKIKEHGGIIACKKEHTIESHKKHKEEREREKNNFGIKNNNENKFKSNEHCDEDDDDFENEINDCQFKEVSVTALNSNDEKQINQILKKYKIRLADDISFEMSEAEMDNDVNTASALFKTEIPHRHSIHTYTFPKNINLREIASEFKKLRCVRAVQPKVEMKAFDTATDCLYNPSYCPSPSPTSSTDCLYNPSYCPSPTPTPTSLPTSTPTATPTPISTFNPRFNVLGGTDQYNNSELDLNFYNKEPNAFQNGIDWWYKDQRIWEARSLYNNSSTTNPKIAVLDSGFDLDDSNKYKPNYLDGYSVIYDPTRFFTFQPISEIIKYDVQDRVEYSLNTGFAPSSYTIPNEMSHGTAVASLIGGKTIGILPNSQIIPIRLRNLFSETTVRGLHSAYLLSPDVINLSIGIGFATDLNGNRPATEDILIRTEVAYLTSKGVTVVIPAGNTLTNLDTLKSQRCLDTRCINREITETYHYTETAGAIVVGGTQNHYDSLLNRQYYIEHYKSNIDNEKGSNYGTPVTISAGGFNILTSSYIPSSNIRTNLITEGTSLSTAMVSTTVAMIKNIAKDNGFNGNALDPYGIQKILKYSSNIARYEYPTKLNTSRTGFNFVSREENKFQGAYTTWNRENKDKLFSIRSLNSYNALVFAKNISKYKILTRGFNIDTKGYMYINSNRANQVTFNRGNDLIFGISNIGDVYNYTPFRINFLTTTNTGNLDYAYDVLEINPNAIYSVEYSSGVKDVISATGPIPELYYDY